MAELLGAQEDHIIKVRDHESDDFEHNGEVIKLKSKVIVNADGSWAVVDSAGDVLSTTVITPEMADAGGDATAAFLAAAQRGVSVTVMGGDYTISDTIPIADGQVWDMRGAVITQAAGSNITMFSADSVSDWAILGKSKLKGTLTTSTDMGAEIGLFVNNGSNYRVEGVSCDNMRSHGFKLEGSAINPVKRGRAGHFDSCTAALCRVGIEIDAASAAEFNLISNFSAIANLNGIILGAGNTIFEGGGCVDNLTGAITLLDGHNHAHGAFNGMQIKHNGFSVKAENVTNGHIFNGCGIYGNGPNTSHIYLKNSKGISFNGGVIEVPVVGDGNVGMNSLIDNYIPTTNAKIEGTHPVYIRAKGNWHQSGDWSYNN